MRYATATNRIATDLDLVSSCRHDRLRAALYGASGAVSRPMTYEVVTSAEPVSSAAKAYFLVICMSMVSLFGLVAGGAATF